MINKQANQQQTKQFSLSFLPTDKYYKEKIEGDPLARRGVQRGEMRGGFLTYF